MRLNLLRINLYVSSIFLIIGICFLPTACLSRLAVEDHVVSGKIVAIDADGTVVLDNKTRYYPSRKNLVANLGVGAEVTLRYIVQEERNTFFEYAFGYDSLKEKQSIPVSHDDTLK